MCLSADPLLFIVISLFWLLGIYGVGKAAEHQPAMVVLSHKPPGANKNIAMCGKGIVYDTGGLSIKGKVFLNILERYFQIFATTNVLIFST